MEEIPLSSPKLPIKLISIVKFDLAVGIEGVPKFMDHGLFQIWAIEYKINGPRKGALICFVFINFKPAYQYLKL